MITKFISGSEGSQKDNRRILVFKQKRENIPENNK